jgi:hypothetical protein
LPFPPFDSVPSFTGHAGKINRPRELQKQRK